MPINLTFHEDYSFIIRYDDQLAEICPNKIAEDILVQTLALKNLEDSCREISEKSIKELQLKLDNE
jgi:hypothetical protein